MRIALDFGLRGYATVFALFNRLVIAAILWN